MIGWRHVLDRVGKAQVNYRRPWWLLVQRLVRRRVLTVQDHRTSLAFRCVRGADRMFGEVFHQRVYDVRGAPVRPGDTVIDIGANHGFAACYFAWRGAHVVALEPSKRVFRLLKQNVERNGLGARIDAVEAAAGATSGKASLWETDAFGGGMSTTDARYARDAALEFAPPSEVERWGFAEILARVRTPTIRLLKIDCEGAELEVLSGISAEQRARIESLAVECHPTAVPTKSIVDLLTSWPSMNIALATGAAHGNPVLHGVMESTLRETLSAR